MYTYQIYIFYWHIQYFIYIYIYNLIKKIENVYYTFNFIFKSFIICIFFKFWLILGLSIFYVKISIDISMIIDIFIIGVH